MMKSVSIAGTTSLTQAAPKPSVRRSRGPWSPSLAGPYTLPREVLERLAVALRSFKNREEAIILAVFLARFWSAPTRLVQAFPIDRRALTNHSALGLSEARVRGALKSLEAIGFIDRDPVRSGSRYRLTEAGLHRKPILWRFGADFIKAFAQANQRAKARQDASPTRRPLLSPMGIPRTLPLVPTLRTQVAQKENLSRREVLMGEQKREPNLLLEAALKRLARAIEGKENG